MNIIYQEFKPSPSLSPYVDTYWLVSFDGASGEYSPDQYCIPVGMAEIVVTIDEGHYEINADGQWYRLPEMLMCGVYNDKVVWRARGKTRKFGIRLKPETLHMLFKVPSSILFTDYTDFENILGSNAKIFVEQLAEAPDVATLILRTEALLHSQLNRHKQEHSYLTEAVELIRSSKGSLSIDRVCKSVYVSTRQLQRSFQKELGLSPKTYQRMIRFRHVYRDMQSLQQAGGWAGLSYNLGYADQAHLIRDFKEFTGFIPTELLSNKTHVYGMAERARSRD